MGYLFDFKQAQEYDRWYENPQNRFVADLEDQILLRLLDPVRGERVLDIGCGTGRHLLMFLEMGLDITGLECSPYMLEVAKKKAGPPWRIAPGCGRGSPF